MDTQTPRILTPSAPRRRIGIDDLEVLAQRAEMVIESAHQESFKPEKGKTLRRFSLREVAGLLSLTPSALFQILKDSKDLPQGEKEAFKRLFSLEQLNQIRERLGLLPRQLYDIREAVAFAVTNFKGGAGKSYTARNFAHYAALMGFRVLIIDIDPQGSSTSAMGRILRTVVDAETLMAYLYGREELLRLEEADRRQRRENGETVDESEQSFWTGTLHSSITKTHWPNIDIVSSNLNLYLGDFALGLRRHTDTSFNFYVPIKEAIDSVRKDYDIILFDTPPALSFTTIAAAWAADGLIIPIPAAMPDFESSGAFVKMLHDVLSAIYERYGDEKSYDFFRVLITKYQPPTKDRRDKTGERREQPNRIPIWLRKIFEDLCYPEAMVYLPVEQILGPRFESVYEHEPHKARKKSKDDPESVDTAPPSRELKRASREVLKRAIEATDTVNRQIEQDVIDLFLARRAERLDAPAEKVA